MPFIRSISVGLAVAALAAVPAAHADPTSTVSGGTVVDSGRYVQAPETVVPRDGGCKFWAKSHRGGNDQAQRDFHKGLATMIGQCGG